MKTYLISFILSFMALVIITPILIYFGRKYGIVDKSNRRKIHRGAIPRIGGLGIAIGTLLPVVLLYYHRNDISRVFFSEISNSIVVIGCGLGISLLGFLDDAKGVPAKYKFVFQIIIASVAWYFGFRISGLQLTFTSFDFGAFSYPITILWIVGIINAFNLIDGMDGLSSGVAFFVSITLMVLAIYNGVLFVALISASMAGAVAGFLIYNFNPAKIFMGDSGSMFIGFILAILSIKGGSKHQTLVSLFVPIIAMGLPILDTTLAFTRRFIRKQPIFLADRQHIHHVLLSKGWNQKKVVMVLYSISLGFTLLAMLLMMLKDLEVFLILVVFAIIIIVMITKLGYAEMFYGKYFLRKHEERIENYLEPFFVDNISSNPLEKIEEILFKMPIKGYSFINNEGKVVKNKGQTDPVNFLDIMTYDGYCLRIFWTKVVPSLNSRESVMFGLISKILHQILEKNTHS